MTLILKSRILTQINDMSIEKRHCVVFLLENHSNRLGNKLCVFHVSCFLLKKNAHGGKQNLVDGSGH